jgi:hypothetical protein
MHGSVKQDYLAQAERHLVKVQERVARQKKIIDELVVKPQQVVLG